MSEAPKPAYPDDNPKTIYGVKKPPLSAIPPSSLIHLGLAMEEGERKYGLFNYRDKTVSSSVYYNAAFRHLLEWWDGSNVDKSGCHPLAHVMACCAIILDAEVHGTLNDDRGTPGDVSRMIEILTESRTHAEAPARTVEATVAETVEVTDAVSPFAPKAGQSGPGFDVELKPDLDDLAKQLADR